jgi:hypothetical protein
MPDDHDRLPATMAAPPTGARDRPPELGVLNRGYLRVW